MDKVGFPACLGLSIMKTSDHGDSGFCVESGSGVDNDWYRMPSEICRRRVPLAMLTIVVARELPNEICLIETLEDNDPNTEIFKLRNPLRPANEDVDLSVLYLHGRTGLESGQDRATTVSH